MENMVNVYFFGKKYTVPADLTIMTAMEYAGYTLKTRLRLPSRLLRRLRYNLQNQRRQRTENLSCLSDTGTGRHVCSKHPVLSYRQETLQHRRPSAKPAGHDGALPGNLQLHRL